MFERLRLKLVLVNLSVIAGLFLLLIGGTYYWVEEQLLLDTRHVLTHFGQRIASDTITDIPKGPLGKSLFKPPFPDGTAGPPEGPPPPKPGPLRLFPPPKDDPNGFPVVFFLRLQGETPQLTFTSTSTPIPPSSLPSLIRQTLSTGKEAGTLSFESVEYYFLRLPAADSASTILLFEDLRSKRAILSTILTGLSLAGCVSLILSFFASLFMANRAMNPIRRSWSQQQLFVADASHELRTPLSVIQTNLDLVRSSPDSSVASQDHWLRNIENATRSMTSLVHSLLQLAQADLRRQPQQINTFFLDEAVFSTADSFRPEMEQRRIHLTLGLREEIAFSGNEGQFRQLVGILLDNALRHTPAGGYITVNLEQTPRAIVLTISDTGEGIAPEHQEKIFDRFFQTDPARSKSGAGLGLAIAKTIVESHGGTIEVDSAPGEGSAFIIRLPLP